MADTKISGLTEDTAPHNTSDYVATYDGSAVATKKVRLKNLGLLTAAGGAAQFNPADSTTYYFGIWPHLTPNTTADYRRMYIERAGLVIGARVYIVASAGSAETSTISLRLNNTSDTTISSSVVANAAQQTFSTSALSILVSFGDYFEFKWVTPAWVTNPTNVVLFGEFWYG